MCVVFLLVTLRREYSQYRNTENTGTHSMTYFIIVLLLPVMITTTMDVM